MSAGLYETPRFERFQALIPRVYSYFEPQGFEIQDGPRCEVGQKQDIFRILALAALADWPIWRASLYFAEHARYVKSTPYGHDLPELRALLCHNEEAPVSSVVRFF